VLGRIIKDERGRMKDEILRFENRDLLSKFHNFGFDSKYRP
jgi:hypothetical protein